MSFFNEKDINVEEISRNNRIKKTITKQVASVLKSLQKEYSGAAADGLVGGGAGPAIISSGDLPSHMCHCIEAVFLHGLKKAKLRKKWSGYFGGDSGSASDNDPQTYSFWPYVIKFTHKDTVAQLKRSQHLKCEVGLCRAWVRVALNEGLLESYLSAMLADESATASYYRPVAFLRDSEQPSVLMGLLRGLGNLTFSLSTNMPSLNIWTTGALAIAGIVESVSSPSVGEITGTKVPSPQVSSAIRTAAVAEPADLSVGSVGSSWQTDRGRSVDGSECDLKDVDRSSSSTIHIEPLVMRNQTDSGGRGNNRSDVVVAAGHLHAEVARDASGEPRGVSAGKRTADVGLPDSVVTTAILSMSVESSSLSHNDEGGDAPLYVYSSSGRRNPFLPLADPTAYTAAASSLTTASSGGVSAATATSAKRKSSESVSERRSSSSPRYSCDDDDYVDDDGGLASSRGAAAAWAVPRLRLAAALEPAGNSLGSLTGWACALSPDDDDDHQREPGTTADSAAAIHTAVDSAAAASLEVGSGDLATPSGSPDTSYEDLIRGYRAAPGRVATAVGSSSAVTTEPTLLAVGSRNGTAGNNSFTISGSSDGGSGSIGNTPLPSSVHAPTSAETAEPAVPGRKSPDSDYEVLDPYDGQPVAEDLSECYGKICNEKGLDSQNYQCKACGRPVGIVYGNPRVCTFDGCYYCVDCHENEEYLVPAKVIYNWDFRKFRVSKRCRAFLQSVENQPLVAVSQLNTKLYSHVPELQECRMLRIELCCVRKYLFQCAHHVAEELKRKIWPNEFLYDDPDTYSLVALTQVMSGQLAASLRKVVAFGKSHVYSCAVCQQKGFFCELCNSAKVIFPFETDITVQCEKCRAVYHKACRRIARACPKCARIQERKKALGATDSVPLQPTAGLY